MKKIENPSLLGSLCDLRTRKIKKTFFTQINKLINWSLVEKIIDNHYSKGKSKAGQPSYSGLLLFKMSLLQIIPKSRDSCLY